MKTNLLKLALCALALLPIGAWAETVTVASWNAGTIDGGTWRAVGTDAPSLEYTAKYNNNTTSVTTVTFATSITNSGAWRCALKLEGDFKAGDVITIQPFTQMSNSDFTGGSKYANILLYGSDVKQIADLTGSKADKLTVTDGHEEAGDPKTFSYTLENDYTELYFGRGGNTRINLMKVIVTRETTEEEASVGTTKTWTFDELTTGTVYNSIKLIGDDYYLRGSSTPNRTFTVTDMDAAKTLTFSDGYTVTVGKSLNTNASFYVSGMKDITAAGTDLNGDNLIGAGGFAFNATEAGTLYVYMSNSVESKKMRIYFKGSAVKTIDTAPADEITEVSYTASEAGTFIFGGPDCAYKIYAVRFVPTSEKQDEWLYIGSTGYATWGNNSGKDIESLPDDLKAYSATAGATGSATITLTELDKMRRGQGYVLKGTPNTNYGLTYGGTTVGPEYNGGDMLRVSSDMTDFAATIVGDDSKTRYRYILGNDNGTAKFFVPSGNGTLKKGKAYLQTLKDLTPTSGARGIEIVFEEGETTGVADVRSKMADVRGEYFDLQGRKVAQPTRGLYIVNGKKVILR